MKNSWYRSFARMLVLASLLILGIGNAQAQVPHLPGNGIEIFTIADGNLRVFNSLRATTFSYTTFNPVAPPGIMPARDIDATQGTRNDLHFVMVDTLGGLRHSLRDAAGVYALLGDVKVATRSNPGAFQRVCAASVRDNLHVVGVTTDGNLMHMVRYANGFWSVMGYVKTQAGNPGRVWDVDCAGDWALDQLHVVVSANGNLYHTIRYGNGTWQGFGYVEGAVGAKPGSFAEVACALDGGTLHVLGVAKRYDGIVRLYHTMRYSTGFWQKFFGDVNDATGGIGMTIRDVSASIGIDGLSVTVVNQERGDALNAVRRFNGTWTAFGNLAFGAGLGPWTTVATAPFYKY